jgi:hypothetical protein
VNHPQAQAQFDPDEDLFDFAGVAREPEPAEAEENLEEIFASFRDAAPQEELLTLPVAHAPNAAPPPSAGRAPAASPPATSHAATSHAASARTGGAPANTRAAELVPAARGRLSKGVVAIALAVTALNSVLAVVMLRSHTVSPERASELAAPEAHENAALAAPPGPPTARPLPDPEAHTGTQSHPALDAAREEITRGEYAAARKRVYGLLAIIDRLDDPRRAELEADCQFLIAQSLHLEALSRMGGSQ